MTIPERQYQSSGKGSMKSNSLIKLRKTNTNISDYTSNAFGKKQFFKKKMRKLSNIMQD